MTHQEIQKMFTPIESRLLTEVQKTALLKIQTGFIDFATELSTLTPECALQTRAMNTLLEAKMLCTQAVTHVGFETPTAAKKETTHGDKTQIDKNKKETRQNQESTQTA